MVDQNQAGVQVNGQPVMGGNPYDLIDNKNQVSNSIESQTVAPQAVQNVQAEQTVSVVQQPVVNAAPVVAPQNINVPAQVAPQLKPVVEPGGFTKKFISFIAKLSGQPDPQTGKGVPAVPTNVAPLQPGQVPIANVPAAKVANPFDSIMGGVTGFLDKVESKVESVAGIDLDASINKPAAPVAPIQEQQQVQVEEIVVPIVKNDVDQVIQQPVQEVKVEIKPEVAVELTPEIKKEEQPEQNIEQKIEIEKIEKVDVPFAQAPSASPAVEAVKTEIDSVEKNDNVSVNPMSENIQFGESKSI